MQVAPRKIIGISALILLFLALMATSGYFYWQYRWASKKGVSVNEVSDLVNAIGRHILLPTGETPTVMTVTDREKLSGQLFFTNAKNGDKVLVYETAKKAFLYNPQSDRVVEVGPVTFDTPRETISVSPTPASGYTQGYRFVLLNSTKTAGLTKTYEDMLQKNLPDSTIVASGETTGEKYSQSIVVPLSPRGEVEVKNIASVLGMSPSALPPGEATPSAAADFLVILGTDIQ